MLQVLESNFRVAAVYFRVAAVSFGLRACKRATAVVVTGGNGGGRGII